MDGVSGNVIRESANRSMLLNLKMKITKSILETVIITLIAMTVAVAIVAHVKSHQRKQPPKSAKITRKAFLEWMQERAYMEEFFGTTIVAEWSMVSSNSIDSDGKQWTETWSDKGITNLFITTNYAFTIQVGDKFFTRADLERK